jgi:hypothetical protein
MRKILCQSGAASIKCTVTVTVTVTVTPPPEASVAALNIFRFNVQAQYAPRDPECGAPVI